MLPTYNKIRNTSKQVEFGAKFRCQHSFVGSALLPLGCEERQQRAAVPGTTHDALWRGDGAAAAAPVSGGRKESLPQ